jgi:hypothetical protein
MIHALGLEIQTKLRSKLCPIVVVDGPEKIETNTWGRERIVIQRDERRGDSFASPKGNLANESRIFTRNVGVTITIYARSPQSGALDFEHYERAERVLDLVLWAIQQISAARGGGLVVSSGRFFVPPDLTGSEQRGGAAYELSIGFARSTTDLDWKGEAALEIEITGSEHAGDDSGVVINTALQTTTDGTNFQEI